LKVHFIGIGGIGLSALARFLNFDGHEISGSDMKSSLITKALENEGIKISCPQSASNINDDFDLVIYSAAVTDENPELIEARLKQIRTLSRKEALPIILGDKKNYCVAGLVEAGHATDLDITSIYLKHNKGSYKLFKKQSSEKFSKGITKNYLMEEAFINTSDLKQEFICKLVSSKVKKGENIIVFFKRIQYGKALKNYKLNFIASQMRIDKSNETIYLLSATDGMLEKIRVPQSASF
jgi:hypothetical protein